MKSGHDGRIDEGLYTYTDAEAERWPDEEVVEKRKGGLDESQFFLANRAKPTSRHSHGHCYPVPAGAREKTLEHPVTS